MVDEGAPTDHVEEPLKLGVAISGGGHRATLWGLGALLYLVDSDAHRQVTTISSVSGGSITNGVVGQNVDFNTTNSSEFREKVGSLVTSITTDGLFFYGSATNTYLCLALTLLAITAAAWLLVLIIPIVQTARVLLDAFGWCDYAPAAFIAGWQIAAVAAVTFIALAVGAYFATNRKWKSCVSAIATLVVLASVGIVLAAATGVWEPQLNLGTDYSWLIVAATVLSVLCFSVFVRRSRAAERGLNKVYFHDNQLSNLAKKSVSHIICATDLSAGTHTYFSGHFIYNYKRGISAATRNLSLARAVQSSAALPGAFNARRIDTRALGFQDPESGEPKASGPPMYLVDGGVYDNMADQWFMGLERRKTEWVGKDDDGRELTHLMNDVDAVVVVNASGGWSWQPFETFGTRHFLAMREFKAMSRGYAVMYNTITRGRRSHLWTKWTNGLEKGTLVQINRNPTATLKLPEEGTDESDELKKKRQHFQEIRDELTRVEPKQSFWSELAKKSEDMGTHLRQVPAEDARDLLWHAYINCAAALAAHLDIPIKRPLPTLDEFARYDGKGGLVLNSLSADEDPGAVSVEGT